MATKSVHITTVSDSEARTYAFLPITPPPTQAFPESTLTYVYSTPPSLTLANNADLTHHLAVASAGPPFSLFPVAGGSAICYLDVNPNPEQEEGFLHRTQTVDYIVMLEGELELSLEGGATRMVRKGDIVVQRASMHRWKNLSRTQGARLVAVMLGAEGAVAGGAESGGQNVE